MPSGFLRKTFLTGAFLAAAAGCDGSRKAVPPAPCPVADDAVNAALRQEARENARALADANPGPYAADVKALQAELDGYLARNGSPFYDRIIVIDPGRIDALTALGVPRDEALEGFLADSGYAGISGGNLGELSRNLQFRSKAKLGGLKAINPRSVNIPDDRVCIILPAQEYAALAYPQIPVPGLDLPATIRFFNKHEGWHCKDGTYDIRKATGPGTDIDWLNLQESLARPQDWAAIALLYKKESLADVGALGDMVREGGAPDVVADVAALRAWLGARGDIQHVSTPAAEALADDIRVLGPAAFRAMDDREAERNYVAETESGGLSSAEAAGAFLKYRYGTDADRIQLEIGASAEARRGVDLLKTCAAAAPPAGDAPETALRAALASRGPDETRRLLEDTAFREGGKITPATLLHAYNTLQAGLKDAIRARPSGVLYPVQAMQLRAVFQAVIASEDFAAASRSRGAALPPAAACAAPKP